MLKSCAVKKSSTESEWLPTNKENNEIQKLGNAPKLNRPELKP